MRFFNKKNVKEKTKKIFSSIENNLSTLDEEFALEYLSWLDKKTLYIKNYTLLEQKAPKRSTAIT